MQILRRQGTPQHLLDRAQDAIINALGGAGHLLGFTRGAQDHERHLVHVLTGHRLGTPRDGHQGASFSTLAYSEEIGVRYVDYVFDEHTINPILEVTLDAATGRETYKFHDDTIALLCAGLQRTLIGNTLGQQHALVLASVVQTLNLRFDLNLTVAAFSPIPEPAEQDVRYAEQFGTSHAVIEQDDLVLAVTISGSTLLGYVNAQDDTLIATFIPTADAKDTWTLLDERAAESIASNFGSTEQNGAGTLTP